MPQSLSRVLVHIIFSTKNRHPFISREVRKRLHAYLASICNRLECPAIVVGGTADHVHILCSLSRKVAVAELVREVKRVSSKWVHKEFRDLKDFQWQSGYGAFSIGQSQENGARDYIAKQETHHRETTFREEFARFLAKYGVDYDERYVWD